MCVSLCRLGARGKYNEPSPPHAHSAFFSCAALGGGRKEGVKGLEGGEGKLFLWKPLDGDGGDEKACSNGHRHTHTLTYRKRGGGGRRGGSSNKLGAKKQEKGRWELLRRLNYTLGEEFTKTLSVPPPL